MTPTARWSILSLALAAAGGLGALRSDGDKPPQHGPPVQVGRAPQPGQPRSFMERSTGDAAEFSRPAKPAPVSWRKSTAAASGQNDGAPAGSGLAPGAVQAQQGYGPSIGGQEMLADRHELEWRALKVEQEASKKLKNLLQVLDLPEDRQDRIFVALAKNSEYYHPLLSFQGPSGGELAPAPAKPKPPAPLPEPETPGVETPPPQPEQPAPEIPAENHDPVLDELTPEERLAYERAEAEREEFWSGVVEEVEAQLDAPATP